MSSIPVYSPEWWATLPTGHGAVSWNRWGPAPSPHDMAPKSKRLYNQVHPDMRSNIEQTVAAFEYLLDVAIKKTTALLVGLSQNQKRAARATIAAVSALLVAPPPGMAVRPVIGGPLSPCSGGWPGASARSERRPTCSVAAREISSGRGEAIQILSRRNNDAINLVCLSGNGSRRRFIW